MDDGRIKKTVSVNFSLMSSLKKIREDESKNSGGSKSFNLTPSEIISLGRLINTWPSIVGGALGKNTCPYRLFRNTLYITVSDSQWMQTLLFYREEIIKKTSAFFSDFKISRISAKIGPIPEEYSSMIKKKESWPDWRKEEKIDLRDTGVEELNQTLERCRQKMNARVKGLETSGYRLCKICRGSVTRSADRVCAICLFTASQDRREQTLLRIKSEIAEVPWISKQELLSIDPELTDTEYETLKSSLLTNSLSYVRELAEDLAEGYEPAAFEAMKAEMARALILYKNMMPDEADAAMRDPANYPDSNWSEWLGITQDLD
ncbi:MAG: DUF721 domain-containing protein [Candidatus Riflebacteria bacterium]|nr:DUF721 domain-containing protein [Candidatus Riflebacteria bacterium]